MIPNRFLPGIKQISRPVSPMVREHLKAARVAERSTERPVLAEENGHLRIVVERQIEALCLT